MQHTHGQGLSGAINGSVGGANNARLTPADQMLAKVTRIAGVVLSLIHIFRQLAGHERLEVFRRRVRQAAPPDRAELGRCV